MEQFCLDLLILNIKVTCLVRLKFIVNLFSLIRYSTFNITSAISTGPICCIEYLIGGKIGESNQILEGVIEIFSDFLITNQKLIFLFDIIK